MRYFKVINDTHINGPLQNMTFEDLLFEIRFSKYTTVLNGDIMDLKNCKKSEVGATKDAINHLLKIVPYVLGNHEMGYPQTMLQAAMVVDDVVFAHSHMVSNPEKYKEWNYETMEPGAGWFKRTLITPTIESLRHLKEPTPNDRMLAWVKYHKTCVFGHGHPKRPVLFNDGRAVILPRGVNIIKVDDDGVVDVL